MLSPTFSPVPKSSSSPSAAGPSVSTPIGTTNARAGMRESTVLAYAKDVRLFIQAGGCIPCDAALVLRYVAATRQTVAPTTLHRRLMAIAHEHRARGLPSPIDDPEVRPLARALQLGQVPGKDLSIPATNSKSHKAKASFPITRRLLGSMLEYMHRNLKDRRDRACLLLGFAAALKRDGQIQSIGGDTGHEHPLSQDVNDLLRQRRLDNERRQQTYHVLGSHID